MKTNFIIKLKLFINFRSKEGITRTFDGFTLANASGTT